MSEQRISVKTAAAAFRSAQRSGLTDADDSALLFHDVKRMQNRLNALSACFPASALHALAIKANPLIGLLERAVQAGAGLEAASIEEVHIALAAGCPPERLIFDSPARTQRELEFALAHSIHVNANSIEEIQRIAELKRRIDSASVVGLRVNPLVGSGTIRATSVASRDSKFGVPLEPAGRLLEVFAEYPWLEGLHYHVGSQGCGLDLLLAAAKQVAGLRKAINQHLKKPQVTTVDIGGGLPAQYLSSQPTVSYQEYAERLRHAAPSLFADDVRLITEFGRSLQASCGFAVARVESVKRVDDVRVLTMHLGSDLLIRPVYQPEHWQHEYAVLDEQGAPKSGPTSPWTIAGPMCFSDVVARNVELPEVNVGDHILIRDTGAYTLGMWSRYCSRAMPTVLGYENSKEPDSFYLLKRRETIEEVVDHWRPSPPRQ